MKKLILNENLFESIPRSLHKPIDSMTEDEYGEFQEFMASKLDSVDVTDVDSVLKFANRYYSQGRPEDKLSPYNYSSYIYKNTPENIDKLNKFFGYGDRLELGCDFFPYNEDDPVIWYFLQDDVIGSDSLQSVIDGIRYDLEDSGVL